MHENDYTGTTNSKCHIKQTENTCIIILIDFYSDCGL